MATADQRARIPVDLRADGMRVTIIASRWNRSLVERLIAGAEAAVALVGAEARHEMVAGSLELPLAAKFVAEHTDAEAIVVLGTVIRGETSHYELVSEGCARGVLDVQLATGRPIGFGVLTVEDERQALSRSRTVDPAAPLQQHNVGFESTIAAVELALLKRRLAAG